MDTLCDFFFGFVLEALCLTSWIPVSFSIMWRVGTDLDSLPVFLSFTYHDCLRLEFLILPKFSLVSE